MRKNGKQNRLLASALCLCLLAGVLPLSGMDYAGEQGCTHIHDENCGYIEAKAGHPCAVEAAHIHDADCGGGDSGRTAPSPMRTTKIAAALRRRRARPVPTSTTRTAAG